MYNDRLEQVVPWTLFLLSMCLSPDGFIEYFFSRLSFSILLGACPNACTALIPVHVMCSINLNHAPTAKQVPTNFVSCVYLFYSLHGAIWLRYRSEFTHASPRMALSFNACLRDAMYLFGIVLIYLPTLNIVMLMFICKLILYYHRRWRWFLKGCECDMSYT